jgi:hypothetical protein
MTPVLPPINMTFYPYILHQGNAVSPYWAHKRVNFSPFNTFCSQTSNYSLLFFHANWKQSKHVLCFTAAYSLHPRWCLPVVNTSSHRV